MRVNESIFADAAAAFASRQLIRALRPAVHENIRAWCERNIDLSYDHTSSATGLVRLYPYQIEPLNACDDPQCQEVTLQMGQRLGKSSIWKYAMLKRVHDGGCSGLIVYPSLDLAIKTNTDTVVPLLQTLPDAARDLASRGNKKKASFHLPSQSSIIYFQGGGAQIISSTANFTVLDESDYIELQNADEEQKNMSQIKALRLRMQSFQHRMMIVCSSPSQYGGTVHVNWNRGSRGEWHLRCLHCGEPSPVSKLAFYLDGDKWAGLQWQKNENGEVIEDSIVWICPHCGNVHHYQDAWKMNEDGLYIHQRPSNILHRSFQVGALANPTLWTWREIAQAQEDATDGDGKKYLCNTILGIPYKHRAEGDSSVSTEDANRRRLIEYPSDLQDRLSIVVMATDQQKSELGGAKYYVSVVRGWDDEGNSYLLDCGTDNSLAALEQRLEGIYHGHKVSLCLIDNGGFDNTDDLDPFIKAHPSAYYYKGQSAKHLDNMKLRPSATQKKLILFDALKYQVRLLDLLYSPKRPKGYGWYLPPTPDETYFQQLCSVKPNTRMSKDSNGYEYANWAAFGGARRDFFDAEKMCLCALDLAVDYLPPKQFARGRLPVFAAREKVIEAIRARKQQGTV
ncbi:MAG: phage terminase large subunit family protein [Victivallales bacterium]|nr:phage terminase large subunit family protein [Victivallales bacterium]